MEGKVVTERWKKNDGGGRLSLIYLLFCSFLFKKKYDAGGISQCLALPLRGPARSLQTILDPDESSHKNMLLISKIPFS